MRRLACLLALLATAGCGATPAHTAQEQVAVPPNAVLAPSNAATSPNVPAYVNNHFEPFTRVNAVAIALREWRLFGQVVDDDPPGTHDVPDPERLDHQPGLWQRVGDYWFAGQDPGTQSASWTGKYNDTGTPYRTGDYSHAWSAAFISYVMRMSGAGDRFLYSGNHADYVNAAVQGLYGLKAFPPEGEAPLPGDLICLGRGGRASRLTFAELPAGRFPGHCDLVVAASTSSQGGQLTVVGGNVDAGVTTKHIPTAPDGRLATPDGTVVDTRYPWLAVLRPAYDEAPALVSMLGR